MAVKENAAAHIGLSRCNRENPAVARQLDTVKEQHGGIIQPLHVLEISPRRKVRWRRMFQQPGLAQQPGARAGGHDGQGAFQRLAPFDVQVHAAILLAGERLHLGVGHELGAGRHGMLAQDIVEGKARQDEEVVGQLLQVGQLEPVRDIVGVAQGNGLTAESALLDLRQHAHCLQHFERPRRQPIAAGFIAGEIELIQQRHAQPAPGEKIGRRRASRPGADHCHIIFCSAHRFITSQPLL